MELGAEQHRMLCEALRRYTRFHSGEPITLAWTGLEYATPATTVTDCSPPLMSFIGKYEKGCLGWLSLTDEGAKIVQVWLDLGFTYENIERNDLPPIKV